VASPGVTRFTTRDTRCVGGIHICTAVSDPQTLEIHFYDKEGIDLSTSAEKKVERLYFRQEFRRAFFNEVGEIIYPPRALEYYSAGLSDALDSAGPVSRHFKVVADLGMSPASFVLPSIASNWDIELISLRSFVDSEQASAGPVERDALIVQLARTVDVFQADLGVSMDSTAERITLVTGSGRTLDHNTALHTMVHLWCAADLPDAAGLGVAVPVNASRVVERIAAEHGRAVHRVGTSRRMLSTAALDPAIGFAGSRHGGYVFPRFLAAYDAMMSFGMLLRLLGLQGKTLDEVVEGLPEFHLREEAVFCPFDRKGAVMRTLAALADADEAAMVEGVRIPQDGGWALVLPHATEALVYVYSEGPDAESADEILRRYVGEVQQAIAAG